MVERLDLDGAFLLGLGLLDLLAEALVGPFQIEGPALFEGLLVFVGLGILIEVGGSRPDECVVFVPKGNVLPEKYLLACHGPVLLPF